MSRNAVTLQPPEWTRRNAVLEDKIERALAVLDSLDDSQTLVLLKEMRVRRAFPDWVWREIVRRTPLRLEEVDINWEKVTAEEKAAEGKNDPITKHWKAIMKGWIGEGSAWRDKHRGDLSLVTIRAVCDQIAEMAQYARGVQPEQGIGQKALWYARGDKGTKFFRPAKPGDLAPGTSLFWAEWQNQPPEDNVKKIPTNLFSDLRTDTNVTIHDGLKDANGCIYHVGSDHLVSRDCPIGTPASPSDLTPVLVQWLNWKHEATVVEVDEKHGRVITFETGPIGIRYWPLKDKVYGVLDHWRVYAGFAPSTAEHKDIDPYLKGILPGR